VIRIRIKSFFAVGLPDEILSQFMNNHSLVVEVEPRTSIAGLLRKMPWLGLDGSSDSMLVVFVNDKWQPIDYVLQEGDVIDIHTPVSGG
jgi:molybdopterin converting factor small subunit